MTRYLYLDPDQPDAVFISSEPPHDDAGMWWEVPSDADPNRLYIALNGEPAVLPPRPGDWAAFDVTTGAWIDPRTSVELAAALNAKRATAVLDKSDLLWRLREAGILPAADVKAAARGEIPSIMADTIAVMPPDMRDYAEMKWAADTQISRTNPLIVLAAHALRISDEQLDQIFGVAP